ncbi:MAG: hypothetical protein QOF30_937 [Acidimicrobiaceae bacterium]|nr:hypothetical protein [Acidimicrobiaceae bacterium]
MPIARTLNLKSDAAPRSGGLLGDIGPRQRTALISWAAFAVTFGGTRALTYAIKEEAGPFRDLNWGGVHLHHYLWGIKLLAASGGVAIHGADRFRANPLVAVGYGAGAALVIDESALLVHFKDVYWSERGRVSMLIGAGLIGAVGASFAFIPAWQRYRKPPAPSESPASSESLAPSEPLPAVLP